MKDGYYVSEERQRKSKPLPFGTENILRTILLIVHTVFEMLTHGSIRNDIWYQHLTDKCTPEWRGAESPIREELRKEKAYTFLLKLNFSVCVNQWYIYEPSRCTKFQFFTQEKNYVSGTYFHLSDWIFLLLYRICLLRNTWNRFAVPDICWLIEYDINFNSCRISSNNHVKQRKLCICGLLTHGEYSLTVLDKSTPGTRGYSDVSNSKTNAIV